MAARLFRKLPMRHVFSERVRSFVCFWWMHRISKRQDALLKALREQTGRIEEVSNAEHELVREMHPKVASFESDMADVSEVVKQKD